MIAIPRRDELVDFLGKVPERWEVLDRDNMSVRESKLTLLVFYAGLTEYRFDFFYRLQDHPQGFVFEGQASGRRGFAEIGFAAFSEAYPFWVEAYELHESRWFENASLPKLELVPRFEVVYRCVYVVRFMWRSKWACLRIDRRDSQNQKYLTLQ